MIQIIMNPVTVSLILRPLSLEGSNLPFDIFNPPVGPKFLLFKRLNLSFDLSQFFILIEN